MKIVSKFLFVTGLLIAAACFNTANASGFGNAHNNTKKINLIKKNAKPAIQIIYLYTTCPNGAIRCVGNIGLTDNGTYISSYYWGESVACANDQMVYYA